MSVSVTPRQLQVLTLVADGLSNDEIGAKLDMSGTTAKTHLMALTRLFGAVNRTHLAALAYQHGLLPVDGETPRQLLSSNRAELVRVVARELGVSVQVDPDVAAAPPCGGGSGRA